MRDRLLKPMRVGHDAIEKEDDVMCIKSWVRIANTVRRAAMHNGIHIAANKWISETSVDTKLCNKMTLQFGELRQYYPDGLPKVAAQMYRYAAARAVDRIKGRTSASQPMIE